MEQQITEQQAIEERQKYVTAFNDTMIKIWKEQITRVSSLSFQKYAGFSR